MGLEGTVGLRVAATVGSKELSTFFPMTPSPKSTPAMSAASPRRRASAHQQGWQQDFPRGGSSSGPSFLWLESLFSTGAAARGIYLSSTMERFEYSMAG